MTDAKIAAWQQLDTDILGYFAIRRAEKSDRLGLRFAEIRKAFPTRKEEAVSNSLQRLRAAGRLRYDSRNGWLL